MSLKNSIASHKFKFFIFHELNILFFTYFNNYEIRNYYIIDSFLEFSLIDSFCLS